MDTKADLDKKAKAWTKSTVTKLKDKITGLGIKHAEPSSRKAAIDLLNAATSKKYGMVNRIRFRFPRHMVFVHKGVSRGHPISNPREAKEWFNPVIEKEIEALADIVAENSADMLLSAYDRLLIQ